MAVTEYYTPTHIYFGAGAEELIGEILKKNGAHKVLVHYGGGSVKRSGLYDRVIAKIKENGLEYVELGGVVPNPRLSLVRKGIKLCRDEGVDYILALGAGSVLDSAKAIGYGAFDDKDLWDFYLGKREAEGTVPVCSILTLSATGSEMSNSSVITNDEAEPTLKIGSKSDFGRISFALMNPELTYTVPKYQTAAGSVDIMMHTFERYFHQGYALDLTDEISFAVLKSVIKWAPVAIEKPDDYDARANLMWAGSISHNGLTNACNSNAGDWACHQMEHELSAEYDVTHGAGLAAVWGSWARYVLDVNVDKFVKLGEAVWGESDPVKTIEKFEEFFRSIGMPANIKELGLELDDEACMTAARNICFQGTRKFGNFKLLGVDEVYEIYKAAAGLKKGIMEKEFEVIKEENMETVDGGGGKLNIRWPYCTNCGELTEPSSNRHFCSICGKEYSEKNRR